MQKKRLSIAIFIDTFFPMIDGVVIAVDNYATKLSKENDVIVFAPKIGEKHYHIDRPYKVVRCHTTKVPFTEYELSLPFIDREFRKAIKKSHYDIVHIHSPFTIGEMGVRYAKRRGVPVVSTYHSQYKKDFEIRTKSKTISDAMMLPIMRVFNKCDMSYAVNRKVKEVYKAYGSKVDIVVRNNGTDLKYYENKKEISKLRKSLDIKKEEKVLLFVGRIDVVKNIFFIVESLKQLSQRNFSYKMLFIGSGPDKEALEAKVKEYQLSDNVLFLGKITGRVDISRYYNLADLFLFPSLYDSSSLVQIEAASQKTPSLFIEGAVTADTIDKDINGYTSKNDVNDYTNEIIKIFSDKPLYKKVCAKTYEMIYKTWDEVVEKTHSDYIQLIESFNKEK